MCLQKYTHTYLSTFIYELMHSHIAIPSCSAHICSKGVCIDLVPHKYPKQTCMQQFGKACQSMRAQWVSKRPEGTPLSRCQHWGNPRISREQNGEQSPPTWEWRSSLAFCTALSPKDIECPREFVTETQVIHPRKYSTSTQRLPWRSHFAWSLFYGALCDMVVLGSEGLPLVYRYI